MWYAVNFDVLCMKWENDTFALVQRMRSMVLIVFDVVDFCSHAGAKVSVIYHTFIETCKMWGVSTLEDFKEFFKAIMQGRTDYENMLPMTIGIKK